MIRVHVTASTSLKENIYCDTCRFESIPGIGEMVILPNLDNDLFKVTMVWNFASPTEINNEYYQTQIFCEIVR